MRFIYKLFLLLFLLASLSKTYLARYPFTGLELSNYEIGDTLEYATVSWSNSYYTDTDLYVITGKQAFATDSVKYTFQLIDSWYNVPLGGVGQDTYGGSNRVYSVTVTNDSIYNRNNILFCKLSRFDTTGYQANNDDSEYVKFDTVNQLKRFRMSENLYKGWIDSAFEAMQNIGIIYVSTYQEGEPSITTTLIYARLNHYGVYGRYYNIPQVPNSINNLTASSSNVSMRYDGYGNALLLLSSNQNLWQPTFNIYDMLGRKVKSVSITEGANLINMSTISAGMYLYGVHAGDNVIGQGKLMKY